MLGLKLLKSPVTAAHTIRATRRALAFSNDETKAIKDQVENAKNAFGMFKLEERLKIDERKLKREMHKLQRVYHPDKLISPDTKEATPKTFLLSTVINQSYQTLKDPYKRAKYLLEVKFKKSSDEVEAALDQLVLDPEFLGRMMDIRERVAREDKLSLVSLTHQVESELDEMVAAIDEAFQNGDYKSVLSAIGKLKFLANCQSALRSKIGDDI